MQIKLTNKYILIYLLLCSLFLTSYLGILNINSIISPDMKEMNIFDTFSVSGRNEDSSMTGKINFGHNDYIAPTKTAAEASNSLIKRQSRWPDTITNFNGLSTISSAYMTCLAYLRLSDQSYTHLISNIITVFLHKKDGMK